MAFTAQLGTASSYPGNIVPGYTGAAPVVSASGVWEFAGAASGSLVIPTQARTTKIDASAIVSDADTLARVTLINAAALISDADQKARTTLINALILYQPLTAKATWAFGGQAVHEKALEAAGVWELAGRAIALVDSIHLAGGAGVWEFGGSAAGYSTGTVSAAPAGVWEFGGSVTVDDGTSEECITADGTAEGAPITNDAISNYVF